MKLTSLVAAFSLIFLTMSSADAARNPDDILRDGEIHINGWHKLSNGNKVRAHAGDTLIADPDEAQYLNQLWSANDDPNLEGYLYEAANDRSLYLSHYEVGFVEMDDWADLDVDELWQSYLDGARAQSRELGYEVKPLRWAVPPTLVADKSVAFYGIEVQFGDEAPLINLVVFDFGRQGYEEITVVMGAMRFGADKAEQIALESASLHKFGEGYRYQDFVQGDKIAAMGAAAVVAGSLLGVRWNKSMFSGIIAGIVLVAKKAWFLLILPFIWLGRVVTRMFGGGRAEE